MPASTERDVKLVSTTPLQPRLVPNQPIPSRLPHETSPSTNCSDQQRPLMSTKRKTDTMAGEPAKKQKREEYKKTLIENDAALPKKKFYRQRAHANPFSDHSLE